MNYIFLFIPSNLKIGVGYIRLSIRLGNDRDLLSKTESQLCMLCIKKRMPSIFQQNKTLNTLFVIIKEIDYLFHILRRSVKSYMLFEKKKKQLQMHM